MSTGQRLAVMGAIVAVAGVAFVIAGGSATKLAEVTVEP